LVALNGLNDQNLASDFNDLLKIYNTTVNNEEQEIKNTIETLPFNIDKFSEDCSKSGLVYSNKLITRFAASLLTKPFVILTGLSGSGKTKLAQSFAQWVCEYKAQYCIVPVGADWTNREPLLGYVNALDSIEYILPENGALQLLIEANKVENINKPYFLILDEMNLSHVERYFADFLSVMESKDKFKLHSDKEKEKSGVPFELGWPKNLFIVGTVNIDETTYMFSPKVLDRANVIEFRVNETEIEDFLNSRKEITSITKMGAAMGNSFVGIAKNNENEGDFTQLNTELIEFFKNLQELGAEFGYRTATEIQTLFSKIDLVNPAYSDKENEKIDIAIMQKLLPKLHGSRRKLLKTLNLLAQKCLQKKQEIIFNERGVYTILEDNSIKYKLSFEKIARMYKNAIENGFASYAEA
jgi:5-methylcytosine-specific restriction protein B